jgi:Inner membrane component of T3SS, cytoplasmic domain
MLLRVLTGRRAGKVVPIVGQEFVVGSSRGCDLVLADDGVDARHAVFRLRSGAGCFVEDLGTAEGTFVAGRRIRGSVQVRGNEEICFGRTYATLILESHRSRRRRVPVAVGLAAVAGVALVALVAGVLLPRTGGGTDAAPPERPVSVKPVRDESPAELPRPADEPHPAPAETEPVETSESGSDARPTVVREDFSDPGSGWEIVDDPVATGDYSEGDYVIDIAALSTYVTVDSGIGTERPVISATVRNPGRSPSAGFGILCRYRSETDFVALVAGTDGRTAVLRRHGGELAVISNGGTWVTADAIAVNAPAYRLRADCRKRSVALFVDGRKVVTARSPLVAGHVGLFAAGRVEFHFDDVVIADMGPARADQA